MEDSLYSILTTRIIINIRNVTYSDRSNLMQITAVYGDNAYHHTPQAGVSSGGQYMEFAQRAGISATEDLS